MKPTETYIYIICIKALTGLGKLGRRLTDYPYTHIAVSLDESLTDFISFSRKKHYGPFHAGFMHEKRSHYAFGEHRQFECRVFRLPVSEESDKKIRHFIKRCEKDKEYVFNLYSMLTMPLLHGFRIYKAYNCMSFTGRIVQMSGCVRLQKPYYKYTIQELDSLLADYFYFEGSLQKNENDRAYMEKSEIPKNIYYFGVLNGKLIYRLLFDRRKEACGKSKAVKGKHERRLEGHEG